MSGDFATTKSRIYCSHNGSTGDRNRLMIRFAGMSLPRKEKLTVNGGGRDGQGQGKVHFANHSPKRDESIAKENGQ